LIFFDMLSNNKRFSGTRISEIPDKWGSLNKESRIRYIYSEDMHIETSVEIDSN